MKFHRRLVAAAVCALLVGAACGERTPEVAPDLDQFELPSAPAAVREFAETSEDLREEITDAVEAVADVVRELEHHQHGEGREVPAGTLLPTVEITVTEASNGGWDMHAQLTHFAVVPERALPLEHVDGEGHLRVYIDGADIGSAYSPTYHLGSLEEGRHEVRVDLLWNDRMPVTVDGHVIGTSALVDVESVPEAAEEPSEQDQRDVLSPPNVMIEVAFDAEDRGWNVHVSVIGFVIGALNSGPDSDGYVRLTVGNFIDTRMYGEWHQIPAPLGVGNHEVRAELRHHDDAVVSVDGEPVAASTRLLVQGE